MLIISKRFSVFIIGILKTNNIREPLHLQYDQENQVTLKRNQACLI